MELEINLQIIIGIAIISLLFLLIHPFYMPEGFVVSNNTEYTFNGTRWTSEQIRNFRETIQKIIIKFDQIQTDLYTTLQEYRTLDGYILEGAKQKKAEIIKNEEQIKEASESGLIPGLTTLTSDPVEDYYKTLKHKQSPKEVKKENINKESNELLPLAATAEISSKTGLQYEIPKIVLPDTLTLTKEEEYSWLDKPDGKERYDAEQKFYMTVGTLIPMLQKAIGELYTNANILRISAGSKTYSLLPRVEAIQKEIENQQKLVSNKGQINEAKDASKELKEGFQGKESTVCKKTIVYQAEDYTKWTTRLKDSQSVIQETEKLIQNAESDIQIAKKIMEDIKKKGAEQRAKIRRLRPSRIE